MSLDSSTIESTAALPKKTRTEEGTVEERSVNELIDADNHLSSKAANASGAGWGIKLARTQPAGTVVCFLLMMTLLLPSLATAQGPVRNAIQRLKNVGQNAQVCNEQGCVPATVVDGSVMLPGPGSYLTVTPEVVHQWDPSWSVQMPVPDPVPNGDPVVSGTPYVVPPVSEIFTECTPPTQVQHVSEPQLLTDIEADLDRYVAAAQSRGPSDRVALKVTNGNSCGSGSVVGIVNGEASLVLTNAHVAGTRVGRTVLVDIVENNRRQRYNGRVIMAAYSDRFLTDWAVLRVPGLTSIEPVKLSKEKPTGTHYTRGSPRCVWPLVSTSVITANISDRSPLWRWRPNAIGGQSGSGVWSTQDNLQYGLLTWSWGGLGAGQQTSEIFRQAAQQTVVGAERIGGLKELADNPAIVEVGFFSEAGITDLPIWDDGTDDDGGDDTDPPPVDDAAIKAVQDGAKQLADDAASLHKKTMALQAGDSEDPEEMAFRRTLERVAKERNMTFSELIALILKILEIIQQFQ